MINIAKSISEIVNIGGREGVSQLCVSVIKIIIINNWNDELFSIDKYNIPKVLYVNNVKNLQHLYWFSDFLNLNFRIIEPKIDILLLFCIVNRIALENIVFFFVEMDSALKITIV